LNNSTNNTHIDFKVIGQGNKDHIFKWVPHLDPQTIW